MDLDAQAAGPLTLHGMAKPQMVPRQLMGLTASAFPHCAATRKSTRKPWPSALSRPFPKREGVRLNVGTLGTVGLTDIKQIF